MKSLFYILFLFLSSFIYANPIKMEVEDNYYKLIDVGNYPIKVDNNVDMSNGKSLIMYDKGDKIGMLLNIPTNGNYIIKIRLRSGDINNTSSYFNSYKFKIDNIEYPFEGLLNTIVKYQQHYGYSYFGEMSSNVYLNSGSHELTIEVLNAWSVIDYIELIEVNDEFTDIPTDISGYIEVENNYTILNDVNTNPIRVDGSASAMMSGGKALTLYDKGDKVNVLLNVNESGEYKICVRTRSGDRINFTSYWNDGYKFTLDGVDIPFFGNSETVEHYSQYYGNSTFGLMESSTINLPKGAYNLTIEAKKSWAVVDYCILKKESELENLQLLQLDVLNDVSLSKWCDFDNDGDLDVFVGKRGGEYEYIFNLYTNQGNNNFTSVGTPIILPYDFYIGYYMTVGDYNNDSYLDVLVTTLTSTPTHTGTLLINQNGVGFVKDLQYPTKREVLGSYEFFDVDRDGDLDVYTSYRLFENPNMIFSDFFTNTSIDNYKPSYNNIFNSENLLYELFVDYDNDGDLDLMCYTDKYKFYKNNNGSYEFLWEVSASTHSLVGWNDVDSDGDLDFIVPLQNIVRNNITNFTIEETYITNSIFNNKADFDNDGVIDSVGSNGKIYLNGYIIDYGSQIHTFEFLDFDNDGDLDMILNHLLYINNFANKNTIPSTPNNLTSTVTDDNVLLSWNNSNDDYTPTQQIRYNIKVYRNGESIVSYNSCIPNVNLSTKYILNGLEDGLYEWYIQSVDGSNMHSAYAKGFFLIGDSSPTPNIKLEAEDIYTVSVDNGNYPIKIDASAKGIMSNDEAVTLYDKKDKIDLHFNIKKDNNYLLKIRLRSGHQFNYTSYFNSGYKFNLNGDEVNFVSDLNSVEYYQSIYGKSAFGMMSNEIYLNSGSHVLSVESLDAWAVVDFIEIIPFSNLRLDPTINEYNDVEVGLDVYPNPTSDILNVEQHTNKFQDIIVRIISNNGVVVLEKELKSKKIYQFDMSSYPKGLYIVESLTEEGTFKKKIVLK